MRTHSPEDFAHRIFLTNRLTFNSRDIVDTSRMSWCKGMLSWGLAVLTWPPYFIFKIAHVFIFFSMVVCSHSKYVVACSFNMLPSCNKSEQFFSDSGHGLWRALLSSSLVVTLRAGSPQIEIHEIYSRRTHTRTNVCMKNVLYMWERGGWGRGKACPTSPSSPAKGSYMSTFHTILWSSCAFYNGAGISGPKWWASTPWENIHP